MVLLKCKSHSLASISLKSRYSMLFSQQVLTQILLSIEGDVEDSQLFLLCCSSDYFKNCTTNGSLIQASLVLLDFMWVNILIYHLSTLLAPSSQFHVNS